MMNKEKSENRWIDIRLTEEELKFIHDAIPVQKDMHEKVNFTLAGNISRSVKLIDKDNWFYETTLKKLTERMFYRDLDAYHKYYIEKEEPPPKFELDNLWVNYMKQHEFNPLHDHNGLFSFVIFVKIPTDWREQHALSLSANSNSPYASDLQFVWPDEDHELVCRNFSLSSEDEGRMLFFPASLQHQVYPFYKTEEERITISGNIQLYEPDRFKFRVKGGEYEKKQNALKMLESTVEGVKKELEYLKKQEEGKIK